MPERDEESGAALAGVVGVFFGAGRLNALVAKVKAFCSGAEAPGGGSASAPETPAAPPKPSAELVEPPAAGARTGTPELIENQFPEEPTPPHGDVVRPSALLKVRGAKWYD